MGLAHEMRARNYGLRPFYHSDRSVYSDVGAPVCERGTNPLEGFIMAYWIAFLDEVEHNLRVFLYMRQKPQRLQSVNRALYLNVEILQPGLPARGFLR